MRHGAQQETVEIMRPERTRFSRGEARPSVWRCAAWGLALAVLLGPAAGDASAQMTGIGRNGIPSQRYFAFFATLHNGDVKEALRGFNEESRSSIKSAQSRWVDAICYETMVGECFFELGDLDQALEHYTAAVKLYVAFADWTIRVTFPPIRPANITRATPWGMSARTSVLGDYPENMKIMQGRVDNNDQIKQGGVVQQAMLMPINVQEIVRCTCLAIRRRATILGPTGPYDPLTQELMAVLARRPGQPNHWSEAWINMQLGLAQIAAGKDPQGIATLKQSLVAGGEFDHPFTSTGLLELGRLALRHGEYDAATVYFAEAGYSAFHYTNPGVIEEAMRLGTITHMLANRPGIYPPLIPAAQWAKKKDLRTLTASLLLRTAENYAFLGQTREAATFAEDAKVVLGRHTVSLGRAGADMGYVAALVYFQQGKIAEGDTAIAAALGYMRQGSLWLYHIGLADRLCASGQLTPRVAMDLYRDVLRDPQAGDWHADPLEALSVLGAPHSPPFDHWFEASALRKDYDAAIEIADRARRHRFCVSQAFGGRLMSLRWILEAPDERLDKQAQLQRQDLLTRYPAYRQLGQQVKAARTALAGLPPAPETQEQTKLQSQALAALGAASVRQEAILREMAVRREPAGTVFPPVRSTPELQKSLPQGHAMLVFYATSRQLYAFLLSNDRVVCWPVAGGPALQTQAVQFLRELGQYGSNHELTLKDLAATKWKQSGVQLLDMLLKNSKADFSKPFQELIIIPDGALWYIPFEAMQVIVDGQPKSLISHVRIRYAPTASLAIAPLRGTPASPRTGSIVGKLYPRDDAAVAQAATERLAEVLPGTVVVKAPLPAPSSLYRFVFDRLIVLDDINMTGAPMDWAPASVDRSKAGCALKDWLCLPWGGPQEIILPGYHTAAEDALKSVGRNTVPGHEVFLSACGLFSTGARTVLLSRWRTGGQTSFNLVREFVQELPHTSPADAWQRAVLVAADGSLNLEAEPRVKNANTDDPPKASHPFFWAGYMLVDMGRAPEKGGEDKPAAKPPVAAAAQDGAAKDAAKGNVKENAPKNAPLAVPFDPGDPNLPEATEEDAPAKPAANKGTGTKPSTPRKTTTKRP